MINIRVIFLVISNWRKISECPSELMTCRFNKWIGPKAFIHCWGYPKIYNLSKKAYDKKITNKVYELTNLL